MRVEDDRQLLAFASARPVVQMLLEDRIHIGGAGLELPRRGKAALIQIDHVRAQALDQLRRQPIAPRRARCFRRRDGGALELVFLRAIMLAAFAISLAAGAGHSGLEILDDLPDGAGAVFEWEIGRALRGLRLTVDLRAHLRRIAEHRLVVERRAGTRFFGHVVVKAQRFRLQPEALLHLRDDGEHRLFLRFIEGILAAIEIRDGLKHERPRFRISIEALRAGRRLIPIAPGPDAAVRRNRDVLRDVRPALSFGVELPHRLDGREAFVLGAIRPPGVVHVHRLDLACERKLFEQLDELLEGELMEWFWHSVFVVMGW
ncbi:MAG: hypothetical protein USCGTAYLOR_00669 [Chromatiales bacterium USCg_Taylor]|nr:MAG: hypothetical protein USCGTAYLOR_00669 [Chromatiales bacterium USCg_Taylor]